MNGNILDIDVEVGICVDDNDQAVFSYSSGNSASTVTLSSNSDFPFSVGETFSSPIIDESGHPNFNSACQGCGSSAGLQFDAQVELEFTRVSPSNAEVTITVSTACCGAYGNDPSTESRVASIDLTSSNGCT